MDSDYGYEELQGPYIPVLLDEQFVRVADPQASFAGRNDCAYIPDAVNHITIKDDITYFTSVKKYVGFDCKLSISIDR